MSKRWEEQLFEAMCDGDERAFERIYDLYHQRARLAAWRISHRADWVDDILNESWCRAFAQRRDYQVETPFLVWLAGIIRNVYREECRRSPLVLAAPGEGNQQKAKVDDLTPETVAQEAELLSGLQDCMGTLGSEDAEIVRLRYFEGLPLRDVADRMGLAESTLRDVRIPAAFKDLRKCLESKGLRFSQIFPAQDRPESQ